MWKVKYLKSVQKDLKKIDVKDKRRIKDYLDNKILMTDDPRKFGKALKGKYLNLWRYRVGDYRIICEIKNNELIVLVIRVSHRKDVY